MRNVFLILAILIGLFLPQAATAQTPLLQSLVDATPECGMLTLPADVVYPGSITIRKCITIESPRTRVITIRRGDQMENFAVGAKVVTSSVEPAFNIVPGVQGVTIRGLEIAASGWVFDIVRIGTKGAAQDTLQEVPRDITLADVAIHGAPDADSQRGVAANGANVSILNSRIYEIHYRGTDSQAIAVWNGPGPFKIINNYLEAAGENFLTGGSDPSIFGLVPSDIEFRRNYVFKPLSWKVGHPSYAGQHWTVKNLLELKNARNVVIDGNVFENNWTDAQTGIPILFTVRNQDCTAPWSTIQNVSFTNSTVKNAEGVFNLLGVDNDTVTADSATCRLRSVPQPGSVRASGLSIRNSLFYNISSHFLVMNGYYNVAISQNTHLQKGNTTLLYGEQSLGFSMVNDVTEENPYGLYGEGGVIGTAALERWTPGYIVTGNVMAHPYGLNPTGNFYPASIAFTSDFRAADWPGKGVDVDALLAAQNGASVPTPTPTPTPSPSPSPSPTPSPLPSPSPTPVPSPSPSPTPSPVPSPSPSPTPTPKPSPSPVPTPLPVRKVAWPNSRDKQNEILLQQWAERYRLKRELIGSFAEFEFVP